jgi:uncharacterized protein YdaU (DUF1376 family)
MTAPYMPLFVSEYLADTAHLSAAEHGAYFMLIMNYWQRGQPLPADDRKLARIARMTDDEWRDARPTIAEFFQESDGLWHHKRIDSELIVVIEKSAKAKSSARASVNSRSTNAQRTLNERSTNAELLGKDRIGKKEDTASAASSSPALPVSKYDGIETECRKAAGLEQNPSPGLMVIGPIAKMIDAGAVIDRDILPVLRAWRAKGMRAPSSWKYFEPMIADAMRPVDNSHFGRGPPKNRTMTGQEQMLQALDEVLPNEPNLNNRHQ